MRETGEAVLAVLLAMAFGALVASMVVEDRTLDCVKAQKSVKQAVKHCDQLTGHRAP